MTYCISEASGVCNASVECCRCSWAEVSFILRKPIKSEEDMMYTVAAAEAGIIFTDQVRATNPPSRISESNEPVAGCCR